MDEQTLMMRIADLDRRLMDLEQQGLLEQGQNAQLPPFVPIPQIGGDVTLPFDGKAEKNEGGEWVIGMEPGQVIPADGGVETVRLDSGVSAGANVTVSLYVVETKDGEQTFVASNKEPELSEGEYLTRTVRLFSVSSDGEVTQYTRGRIDLNGAFVCGEEGGVDEENAYPLSGSVKAQGTTGSGLVMRSTSYKALEVDIAGRGTDEFAIRDVKNSENETIAKVLGTADFSVGGGGDMPDIEVLKDISFDYDAGQHKLTATKTTVNLQKPEEEIVGNPVEIFTAAPHYKNADAAPDSDGMQFEQ